jgi:hypothetical protein
MRGPILLTGVSRWTTILGLHYFDSERHAIYRRYPRSGLIEEGRTIGRQNPRWEHLYADMDKRLATSQEFGRQDQASTASGSFDSGVRPRSG